MSPDILQLADYSLSKLHMDFVHSEQDEGQSNLLSLSFDYDIFINTDSELRRMLALKVYGFQHCKNGQKTGLDFELEIRGIFLLPESMEADRQEALLRLNGVSILYSTLRGIVGNLSGSFPGGRFCLPTVLPQEILKHVEARKQSNAQSPAKPSKKKKPDPTN